ncbi:YdcF family protein [Candidatus Roizmanbacteria bacterium]|nr:YdcF family protein [Candidatus Roizmanbacteria bacterium]
MSQTDLLVFGKGLTLPVSDDNRSWQLLSIESQQVVSAAFTRVCRGNSTDVRVVFLGGRTAGSQYPSESELMKTLFKEIARQNDVTVDDSRLVCEVHSLDTVQNVGNYIEEYYRPGTMLEAVTTKHHIRRVRLILHEFGFSIVKMWVAEEHGGKNVAFFGKTSSLYDILEKLREQMLCWHLRLSPGNVRKNSIFRKVICYARAKGYSARISVAIRRLWR